MIRSTRLAILGSLLVAGFAQGALADCGHPSVRFLKSDRIADKSLGFSEPSGLSLAGVAGQLLSVSDDTAALFQLDLNGAHTTPPKASIDNADFEGIALDPVGNRILIASEGAAGIVVVDAHSGDVSLVPLSDMDGFKAVKRIFKASDPNDGLEGIAVDPEQDRIFLLKEKRPRLMV